MEIPYEDCKRCRIDFLGENAYTTISEDSAMIHFVSEGGYENKDAKALLNLCFRSITKNRKGVVMSWEEIAEMAVKSGIGHKCVTDEIARAIRECQK